MSTTYFFNETAGCTGSASGYDDTLDESSSSGGNKTDSISPSTDRISYRLTNPTGVPGLTTWPAGDYVARVDVFATGNNIDMAALFRRVNASCVEQGGGPLGISSEIDPPSVGINVFTVSVSEQSPASDERLQLDLLVDNDHGHNSQDLTIDYNDSTVVAPWTIGGADDLATKQIFLGLDTMIRISGG